MTADGGENHGHPNHNFRQFLSIETAQLPICYSSLTGCNCLGMIAGAHWPPNNSLLAL
jgi:hypothetical protein